MVATAAAHSVPVLYKLRRVGWSRRSALVGQHEYAGSDRERCEWQRPLPERIPSGDEDTLVLELARTLRPAHDLDGARDAQQMRRRALARVLTPTIHPREEALEAVARTEQRDLELTAQAMVTLHLFGLVRAGPRAKERVESLADRWRPRVAEDVHVEASAPAGLEHMAYVASVAEHGEVESANNTGVHRARRLALHAAIEATELSVQHDGGGDPAPTLRHCLETPPCEQAA